ncbi:Pleckstrin-domain containing protein [Metarhizium album ARSEF 1941]|uniref:Pleckstrin-domain containing protein n=1 Tax=Metarhizium album (strain ARSEF 1941) TaxID=1081103 RepID=A0A0B2WYE5_METAS|nr:Pleckstrin-domain containing protein [Metarhizium album ARSEF 1941]KHN97870.1 Pleckstrin-domain containing protein [Metarhizium album ARSEF 1941]
MADDVRGAGSSPKNEPAHVETTEDAETRATRRELKQSSISDQPDKTTVTDDDRPETSFVGVSNEKSEELKEQVSSPKKKRAHDQLEEEPGPQDNDATSVTSTDSAKDRAMRLEPEKKRHRDEEPAETVSNPPPVTEIADQSTRDDSKMPSQLTKEGPSNTFAESAFGKLASSSSGFAALGSSQGGGFGSAKPALSSFASMQPASRPGTSVTEANKAQTEAGLKLSLPSNSGLSPFAGLGSGANGLGSNSFGSGLSGIKPLSGFGAVGAKTLQSEKAAKPFGAPESDVDDDDNDNDNAEEDDASQADDQERGVSPEKDADEKKRPKLHKIAVDDGEAGEVTVVSVRAKMFCLDRKEGWKERGAGMLKINVPNASVDFDDEGAVVPGSFDASCLETDDDSADGESAGPKVARLILRQDQTHRVILNTAILPAMEFQEKASLKSVGILFTAFEGAETKPVSITMRMSAANSKLFLNEVGAIQRELRGN